MFTRRIIACACALALAVPAAASARPGFDPPIKAQHVAYGDTMYDLQNQQEMGAPQGVAAMPKGDTKDDIAPAISQRHAVVPAGKGVGGRIVPVRQHAVAGSNDLDGWRIAAVAEAGLLAALALGAATFVGRTRPRGGATA
jgi:hypothetical protein